LAPRNADTSRSGNGKVRRDAPDLGSFNSRIRDECLNINSFWSPGQARVVIGDWKMTTTTTVAIPPWATNPRPATLPAVSTDERLLFSVNHSTGSGQHILRIHQ
jgi:hypothetical protein